MNIIKDLEKLARDSYATGYKEGRTDTLNDLRKVFESSLIPDKYKEVVLYAIDLGIEQHSKSQ